jgi:hypothetical protein
LKTTKDFDKEAYKDKVSIEDNTFIKMSSEERQKYIDFLEYYSSQLGKATLFASIIIIVGIINMVLYFSYNNNYFLGISLLAVFFQLIISQMVEKTFKNTEEKIFTFVKKIREKYR